MDTRVVRTITIGRNAEADQTTGYALQRKWPLTPGGIEHAKAVRVARNNPTFDLIRCARLVRATHTAVLIAGIEHDDEANFLPIDELFPAEGSRQDEQLQKMYDELGHGNLGKYIRHEKCNILWDIASAAAVRVRALFQTGFENALIVGEDIITQATAEALLGMGIGGEKSRLIDSLQTRTLEYCGFYKLDFECEGGDIKLLTYSEF